MASSDLQTTISLEHLQRLTDSCGIIQHAEYMIPDYQSGYTTDDNARALAAVANHYLLFQDPLSRSLAVTYLAFLRYAQREDGRFHNFFSYDRRPCDEVGSDDCFGRTLGSLAYLLYAPPDPNLIAPVERMFYRALPWVERLEHPRSKAMCILAFYRWWQARPVQREEAAERLQRLAMNLLDCYREHNRADWQWFLPEMTYANANLPEALFRAYQVTGEQEYLTVATRTMAFLCEKVFHTGKLSIIGNNGWHNANGGHPAEYDQQPIDAAAMVEAALAAFDATKQTTHLRHAGLAFDWFFGSNSKGVSVYDPKTGGCFDGLTAAGVNMNQGAESSVALLQAQLSMLEAREKHSVIQPLNEEAIA